MKTTVKAVCSACNGTGLYRGMAEKPGEAVVCLECKGSGCKEISYQPFVSRFPCKGVERVYRSRGTLVFAGVGKIGGYVTYQDFCRGQMPE